MIDDEQAKRRNPSWTRDEMLLALNHYLQHRDEPLNRNSSEIAELTAQIAAVAKALGLSGDDRLRNTNGVTMKIENFKSRDPRLTLQGRTGLTRGNNLEAELWDEFADRPDELKRIAAGILTAIANGESAADASGDDFDAPEGRLLVRLHQKRERNRELVRRKKAAVLRDTGRLCCEVCGFDFLATYGERGRGFIECHHTVPVSSLGDGGRTSIKDLALVCANCHRMIHAGQPWWSIEDAKAAQRLNLA